MKNQSKVLVTAALLLAAAASPGPAPSCAAGEDAAAAFRKELAARVAAAEKEGKNALRGSDGWLFLRAEMRSVAAGKFWGEGAAKVSKASRAKYADPLPAILEFHEQLKSVGVEMLFVPVPPKSLVYPDKLSEAVKPGADGMPPRLDAHHREFYGLLEEKGVAVLDLWPALAAKRLDGKGASYCRQDTHWSSGACQLTARLIADRYRDRDWFPKPGKQKYELTEKPLQITGDLWGYLKDPALAKETLPMVFVGAGEGGAKRPPASDRNSPVVLIGDSHTLVFSAGEDMHTRGAGLPDHLTAALGEPIDLIGVRGSGATVPRIDLARRKDNLKGKKLVVWCLSARQFTEGNNGWMTRVPVIRAKK
ncbi:MAG: alginate O-acetyltransferase AlgX-related protein [Planctomycetota bacterium]|jgi:alginate O-acetyltransferase complex protein AlgJ